MKVRSSLGLTVMAALALSVSVPASAATISNVGPATLSRSGAVSVPVTYNVR